MAENPYNRWQGLAIGQLSVAVALISGLSISALAVGFSLLQNRRFTPEGATKLAFALSFPLLLLAALLSCAAVISRTLDFRLTARKVRKDQDEGYSRSLKLFQLGPDAYGCITWSAFWCSCVAFLAGVILLVISIGATYADRL